MNPINPYYPYFKGYESPNIVIVPSVSQIPCPKGTDESSIRVPGPLGNEIYQPPTNYNINYTNYVTTSVHNEVQIFHSKYSYHNNLVLTGLNHRHPNNTQSCVQLVKNKGIESLKIDMQRSDIYHGNNCAGDLVVPDINHGHDLTMKRSTVNMNPVTKLDEIEEKLRYLDSGVDETFNTNFYSNYDPNSYQSRNYKDDNRNENVSKVSRELSLKNPESSHGNFEQEVQSKSQENKTGALQRYLAYQRFLGKCALNKKVKKKMEVISPIKKKSLKIKTKITNEKKNVNSSKDHVKTEDIKRTEHSSAVMKSGEGLKKKKNAKEQLIDEDLKENKSKKVKSNKKVANKLSNKESMKKLLCKEKIKSSRTVNPVNKQEESNEKTLKMLEQKCTRNMTLDDTDMSNNSSQLKKTKKKLLHESKEKLIDTDLKKNKQRIKKLISVIKQKQVKEEKNRKGNGKGSVETSKQHPEERWKYKRIIKNTDLDRKGRSSSHKSRSYNEDRSERRIKTFESSERKKSVEKSTPKKRKRLETFNRSESKLNTPSEKSRSFDTYTRTGSKYRRIISDIPKNKENISLKKPRSYAIDINKRQYRRIINFDMPEHKEIIPSKKRKSCDDKGTPKYKRIKNSKDRTPSLSKENDNKIDLRTLLIRKRTNRENLLITFQQEVNNTSEPIEMEPKKIEPIIKKTTKKLKIVINIEYPSTPSSDINTPNEPNLSPNHDLSFLDDLDIDGIVDSLNVPQTTTRETMEGLNNQNIKKAKLDLPHVNQNGYTVKTSCENDELQNIETNYCESNAELADEIAAIDDCNDDVYEVIDIADDVDESKIIVIDDSSNCEAETEKKLELLVNNSAENIKSTNTSTPTGIIIDEETQMIPLDESLLQQEHCDYNSVPIIDEDTVIIEEKFNFEQDNIEHELELLPERTNDAIEDINKHTWTCITNNDEDSIAVLENCYPEQKNCKNDIEQPLLNKCVKKDPNVPTAIQIEESPIEEKHCKNEIEGKLELLAECANVEHNNNIEESDDEIVLQKNDLHKKNETGKIINGKSETNTGDIYSPLDSDSEEYTRSLEIQEILDNIMDNTMYSKEKKNEIANIKKNNMTETVSNIKNGQITKTFNSGTLKNVKNENAAPKCISEYTGGVRLPDERFIELRILMYWKEHFNVTEVIHNGTINSSIIYKCINKDKTYALKVYRSWDKQCKVENKLSFIQKNTTENFILQIVKFLYIKRNQIGFLTEFYPKNLQEALLENKTGFHIDVVQVLAKQLVTAARTLAKLNFVHTSIEPRHILLNSTHDKLKLCGFDAGNYTNIMARTWNQNQSSLSYRAPETILGFKYNCLELLFGVDMWSMALVIHEMACGRLLFPGLFDNEILFKQQCTLGGISEDMLENCRNRDEHFLGYKFMRIMSQYVSYTVKFFKKNFKLSQYLYDTYHRHWEEKESNKSKVLIDLNKIGKLNQLLYNMLRMDPRQRLSINIIHLSEFFDGVFV